MITQILSISSTFTELNSYWLLSVIVMLTCLIFGMLFEFTTRLLDLYSQKTGKGIFVSFWHTLTALLSICFYLTSFVFILIAVSSSVSNTVTYAIKLAGLG